MKLQLVGRVMLILAAALVVGAAISLLVCGWLWIWSATGSSPVGWGGRVLLSAALFGVLGLAFEGAGRLARWHARWRQ